MTTPEARVKQRIKKILRDRKIWYYMPVAGPFTAHGIPDFVCCRDGGFLAIEAKAPGALGNLTTNQSRVIEEIKDHGGVAIVIDNPADLESFLDGGERDNRRTGRKRVRGGDPAVCQAGRGNSASGVS